MALSAIMTLTYFITIWLAMRDKTECAPSVAGVAAA
jgi:hypothetical protein